LGYSGSRDWTLTRTEITTKALQKIGIIGIADTPSANQLTYGAALQNQILKSWQAPPYGARLWTNVWTPIDITATDNSECIGSDTLNYTCILSHTSVTGTNKPITGTVWQKFWYQAGSAGAAWSNGASYTCAGDYDIATGILWIDQVFYRSENYADIQLKQISMEEYFQLMSKITFGTPTSFAIDKQLTPHLYLYPIPDADSNYDDSIHYRGKYLLQDMDNAADNADLPVTWLYAFINALAYELSFVYHIGDREKARLKEEAVATLTAAIQGDTEGPIGIRMYPVL
jgi:hypothetical protein